MSALQVEVIVLFHASLLARLTEHYSVCSSVQKVEQLCNKGMKKVCCGAQFSVVLACDGHVYTFGQGK